MTDISELFPLKATVEEQDLKYQNEGTSTCTGAYTLRKALGDFSNGRTISWGTHTGQVGNLLIRTLEGVNMTRITGKTEVTFVIFENTIPI